MTSCSSSCFSTTVPVSCSVLLTLPTPIVVCASLRDLSFFVAEPASPTWQSPLRLVRFVSHHLCFDTTAVASRPLPPPYDPSKGCQGLTNRLLDSATLDSTETGLDLCRVLSLCPRRIHQHMEVRQARLHFSSQIQHRRWFDNNGSSISSDRRHHDASQSC